MTDYIKPTAGIHDDVYIGDQETLKTLVELQRRTQGRFTFTMGLSGKSALCQWRNYYRTKNGNMRVNKTGSFSMNDHIYKVVILIP